MWDVVVCCCGGSSSPQLRCPLLEVRLGIASCSLASCHHMSALLSCLGFNDININTRFRFLALAAGSPGSRCRRSQPHYFFRVPGILDLAGGCGVLHYSLAPLCMAMQLLALVVRPRRTYIRVSGECHSILLFSQSVPDKLTMCHTTHHGRTLGSLEARGSRRFPRSRLRDESPSTSDRIRNRQSHEFCPLAQHDRCLSVVDG